MPFLFQFILTLATSVAVISGASLVWPKLTSKPIPEPLTKVREIVLQTDIGKQAAQTLGVSDTSLIEPINVSSVASEVVSNVVSNASQKVQDAATKEIIIQVVKKIESLHPEQQEEIKKVICQ
ncbi:MAG: hypothetical protein V1917_00315 [Candidatus Gottesmanbacteria bacterium]